MSSPCPWCSYTAGHEPLCIGAHTVAGPYNNHPPFEKTSDTSRAAAASMADDAPTLRDRVENWIRAQGEQGATDDEIEFALNLRHQTASARRRELELLSRLRKTERTRATRSGRKARVYVWEVRT